MDKNNDIPVNKISKWDAAPKSIKNLRNYISESWVNYAAPPCCPPLDPSCQDSICESMMTLLESVLDDYNELEASRQKDTGMISEYEEENRNLKSELDIKTDECDALISRVFKQDDEYAKLEEEKICLEKELKDLRKTCELLKKVNLKQCNEVDELESEIKQVIDLAKSYGLMIHDDRKDSIPDNVVNIGMCGHYYVFGNDLKNENDRLRNRCNELAFRAGKYSWAIKTVLKKASFSPGHIAEELRFMARESTTLKDVQERWEWWVNVLLDGRSKLVDKINRLEKEIEKLSTQVSSLKEKSDKPKVLPICGEIKWVLREDDV